MGSICLSSVSILRCAPLTRTENIVLIIPPVVEIIFSTSLVVNNWGTGWRHCFLLTFDSWMYLFLALLDLFTRVVPAVQVQLNVFTILDTLIGIASFIPILFYTLFLFFFTRLELLKLLPVRFQNIARFLLILFIPAIVGLNAVASLIGISRVSENNQIFVGFLEDRDRTLWTFFTSMTLALLTAYQAINFSFTFFRLIKGLMAQRDLEAASSDEAYLFKGIGWMSVGLKLGAVETVIGFAQAGFGGVLTRRILRLLCRACLCIGILKGLDTVENYGEFLSVVSRRRSEKPRGRNARPLISNPRHSTFRQLSPTATEFHLTPGIHKGSEKQDRGLAPRSTTGLVGLSEFASIKSDYAAAQRVTIHFGEGAPKLEMRFSQLDMPSPATIVDSKKQDIAEMNERLSEYYKSTMSDRMNRRATLAHSRAVSTMSTKTTDSVKALRELTPQFPVPAHTARGDRSSWNASPEPMPAKKQPIQSRLSQLMTLEEADETDAASQKRNTKFHLPLKRSSDYQTPTGSTPGTMLFRSDTLTTQRTTPGVESPAQFLPQKVDRYDEPDAGFELRRIDSTNARPTAPATRRPSRVSFLNMSDSQHLRDQSISWVQNPYDASAVTPAHSVAEQNDPIINAMSAQSRSLTRIKSVGKVQKKLTPPPSSMTAGHGMRGSIHIEPIFIPPRAPAMVGVEAVQGSDAGSSYAGSPAGQNDTFVPVDRWK